MVGAAILRKHYGIQAEVCTGLGAYRLWPGVASDGVVLFGYLVQTPNGGPTSIQFRSSPDAFHAWIEAEGYLVDFSVRNFSRMRSTAGQDISAREFEMMQAKLCNSAESPLHLKNVGDFYVAQNEELTRVLIERNESQSRFVDSRKACTDWYKKPSEQMHRFSKSRSRSGLEIQANL